VSELFTNNVTTTLSGSITNTATSLTVASATGFPTATGTFRLVIDAEILVCTSRTGTVCQVTRGGEGTTAVSHASGATVKLGFTAAALAAAVSDAVAAHVALGDPHPVYVLKVPIPDPVPPPASGTYSFFQSGLGGGGGIDSLVIDENPNRVNANMVAGGDNTGPKVSLDGGVTWQPAMGGIYQSGGYGSTSQWLGLCQSRDFANYPNRRFGASNGGLYVSDNKGLNWTLVNLPTAEGGAPAPNFNHNAPGKGNGLDLEPDTNQSRVGATTLYAFHGNIDTGSAGRPRILGRILQDDGQNRLFMIDNAGNCYRWNYPAAATSGGTLHRIASLSSTTRGCSVLTNIRVTTAGLDNGATATAFTGTNSPVASWEGRAINESGQVTLYVASATNPDVPANGKFVRIRQSGGVWTAGGTWTDVSPSNGGKNGWCSMDAIRVGTATHVGVGTQNPLQNPSTLHFSNWYVTSNGEGTPTWTSCTDDQAMTFDWHQGGPTGILWWGSTLPKIKYGSGTSPCLGTGTSGTGNGNTYTPEGVYFDPLDSSKLYVCGSGGVYMTNRTTLRSHPMMVGLGVLLNRGVKVDPNNPLRVVVGSSDHSNFTSINANVQNADGTYGTWQSNGGDTGNLLSNAGDGRKPWFDTGRTPSAVFLPWGDGQTDNPGLCEVFYHRNPSDLTVDWVDLGLQSVVGTTGRARGGCARRVGANMLVLVGVSSKGVYARTFTSPDANPPSGGSWVLGSGTPLSGMGSSDDEPADMEFINDTTAFIYDRNSGLWRTVNSGANWSNIWAATAGTGNEGFMTPEIPGSTTLWVTIATGGNQGLWKITNADNGTMNVNGTNATGTAVGVKQTPGGSAPNEPGVVRTAPGQGVIFIDNANPDPKVWLSPDFGTTWTNIADAIAKRAMKKIPGADLGTDGRLYVTCAGSVIVGVKS
jgi:hypothetical protein